MLCPSILLHSEITYWIDLWIHKSTLYPLGKLEVILMLFCTSYIFIYLRTALVMILDWILVVKSRLFINAINK